MEIVVVLDQLRSMYNVGSFFRTCDGAGVRELILTGYTATPPRKEISKTALSAEEHVPWRHFETIVEAMHHLRAEGYLLVAVEKNDASMDLRTFLPTLTKESRVACIFGNEKEGVHAEALALADAVVHLPMLGHKDSLNVAVSGGAFLYALRLA
ncbi:TrmH family RNA methyltransferase [Candidatus Gracilibacteria bacterium CG17_big_fil_post_rev_8_21_14_2_50_48_13]|nr:MAG: TrmH family RNA methyltransferase [Candidatus Gracilibacteria bacterium CG17_big_fil_post_rev_8_21_14_2_50_48_13]